MISVAAPKIYVRLGGVADRVSTAGRIFAAAIAATCFGVLLTAAIVIPSPTGVGTHTSLGLRPCQFLAMTHLPCPGCGMTTSFAWFARGNLQASIYVQPMGTLLAILTAGVFWGATYVAVTSRPIYRLAQRIPSRYYLIYLPSFAIIAWAWKIWIRVHHADGWH
jgi:hypothetical protein